MDDEIVYRNEILEYQDQNGISCILELYFTNFGVKAFARFKDEIDDTTGYGVDIKDKYKAIDDAISNLFYQYKMYKFN
ncbi:hypothetical protein [Bacillus dakarensis]|uniref:hypothetical protein n=1 Tax=Robertmurraya dakarensis TaxID=1926278 RepID=UPI0009809E1E|nr:hypothetical protein [Bacillus dakarensis]